MTNRTRAILIYYYIIIVIKILSCPSGEIQVVSFFMNFSFTCYREKK